MKPSEKRDLLTKLRTDVEATRLTLHGMYASETAGSVASMVLFEALRDCETLFGTLGQARDAIVRSQR